MTEINRAKKTKVEEMEVDTELSELLRSFASRSSLIAKSNAQSGGLAAAERARVFNDLAIRFELLAKKYRRRVTVVKGVKTESMSIRFRK